MEIKKRNKNSSMKNKKEKEEDEIILSKVAFKTYSDDDKKI